MSDTTRPQRENELIKVNIKQVSSDIDLKLQEAFEGIAQRIRDKHL